MQLDVKKAIFLLAILTFFLLIKVYVANQIYYLSRDIQKMLVKIDALKEEHNILMLKTQKLQFQNTVTNSLFIYQNPQEEKEYIEDEN